MTDFGVSAVLNNSIAMCGTFVGTFKYMSPERIRNQPYSYSSDMWSLGMTLVESATATYPYPIDAHSSGIEMVQTIIESEAPSLPPGRYTRQFEEFVSGCLDKDPHQRLSAEVTFLLRPRVQPQCQSRCPHMRDHPLVLLGSDPRPALPSCNPAPTSALTLGVTGFTMAPTERRGRVRSLRRECPGVDLLALGRPVTAGRGARAPGVHARSCRYAEARVLGRARSPFLNFAAGARALLVL